MYSGAVLAASLAVLLPPAMERTLPGGLVVLDERDGRQDLGALAAGTPRLLLPVFTRCRGTCPLTALVLKEALEKARIPFAVLVLSFDADDTAGDLRDFRRRFALPADWMLVRAADPAAIRAFLDGLGFHVRKADAGGFDHPNQTFVFSPEGAWRGTFAGTRFRNDELAAAWRRARAPGRLATWIIRPEAWIAIACIGLGVAGGAIAFAVRRSRPSPRSR